MNPLRTPFSLFFYLTVPVSKLSALLFFARHIQFFISVFGEKYLDSHLNLSKHCLFLPCKFCACLNSPLLFQTVPLDMDQAGLVSSSTDAPYIFPWEHENVLTVQEALSSISSPGLTNPNLLEPVSCSVYGYEESSLDLSTTSPILTSYSFSPTSRDLVGGHLTSSQGRLVTLPPRNSLLDPLAGHHHLESQHLPPQHHMQHQHQQQMPSLASTSIKHEKERRVRARPRSLTEAKDIERPCKVCGERAGKHSYYGGQVRGESSVVTTRHILTCICDWLLLVGWT